MSEVNEGRAQAALDEIARGINYSGAYDNLPSVVAAIFHKDTERDKIFEEMREALEEAGISRVNFTEDEAFAPEDRQIHARTSLACLYAVRELITRDEGKAEKLREIRRILEARRGEDFSEGEFLEVALRSVLDARDAARREIGILQSFASGIREVSGASGGIKLEELIAHVSAMRHERDAGLELSRARGSLLTLIRQIIGFGGAETEIPAQVRLHVSAIQEQLRDAISEASREQRRADEAAGIILRIREQFGGAQDYKDEELPALIGHLRSAAENSSKTNSEAFGALKEIIRLARAQGLAEGWTETDTIPLPDMARQLVARLCRQHEEQSGAVKQARGMERVALESERMIQEELAFVREQLRSEITAHQRTKDELHDARAARGRELLSSLPSQAERVKRYAERIQAEEASPERFGGEHLFDEPLPVSNFESVKDILFRELTSRAFGSGGDEHLRNLRRILSMIARIKGEPCETVGAAMEWIQAAHSILKQYEAAEEYLRKEYGIPEGDLLENVKNILKEDALPLSALEEFFDAHEIEHHESTAVRLMMLKTKIEEGAQEELAFLRRILDAEGSNAGCTYPSRLQSFFSAYHARCQAEEEMLAAHSKINEATGERHFGALGAPGMTEPLGERVNRLINQHYGTRALARSLNSILESNKAQARALLHFCPEDASLHDILERIGELLREREEAFSDSEGRLVAHREAIQTMHKLCDKIEMLAEGQERSGANLIIRLYAIVDAYLDNQRQHEERRSLHHRARHHACELELTLAGVGIQARISPADSPLDEWLKAINAEVVASLPRIHASDSLFRRTHQAFDAAGVPEGAVYERASAMLAMLREASGALSRAEVRLQGLRELEAERDSIREMLEAQGVEGGTNQLKLSALISRIRQGTEEELERRQREGGELHHAEEGRAELEGELRTARATIAAIAAHVNGFETASAHLPLEERIKRIIGKLNQQSWTERGGGQ